jgi:prepilin-type N-terminal cleavage/methylation domain-containing protein
VRRVPKEAAVRRKSGFSLIEVMVVMAILAGLIGGVTLMVGQAQRKKADFETRTRMSAIAAALEQMKDNSKLGQYPPTDPAQLAPVRARDIGKSLGQMNEKNKGIESVFVATRLTGIGVRPDGFDAEGAIVNTDGDSASAAVGGMDKADLYEFADAYNNPFVYIHSRDYKALGKMEQYVRGDGTEVKAVVRKSATGGFARENSFQLYSMGPDGEPGTEDDILYGE